MIEIINRVMKELYEPAIVEALLGKTGLEEYEENKRLTKLYGPMFGPTRREYTTIKLKEYWMKANTPYPMKPGRFIRATKN